jgi:hypothetical protein
MIPEIVISTDIVGMFGKISNLDKLYGPNFRKLEMIGWNITLDKHIKEAKSQNYEILSIHGRLSSISAPESHGNRVFNNLANLAIKSTNALINYSSEYDILLHSATLYGKKDMSSIIVNKKKIKFIWVENHFAGENGISDALKYIHELKNQGINCGLVFDFAHFIGQENITLPNFEKYWNNALLNLSKISELDITLTIHFPVGLNSHDALPVLDKMSVSMISDFTKIAYSGKIQRIVIENQSKGLLDHFLLNAKSIEFLSERNKRIMQKLITGGFIL